jgi:hypothetical protein
MPVAPAALSVSLVIFGNDDIRAQMARARFDDLRRAAERHRTAAARRDPHPHAAEEPEVAVTIRLCRPGDAPELERLAQFDSAGVPAEPLLLALADGVLRAVLSLRDGSAIADPFFPTAGILDLLRVRAQQLGREPAVRPRRWRARRTAPA